MLRLRRKAACPTGGWGELGVPSSQGFDFLFYEMVAVVCVCACACVEHEG